VGRVARSELRGSFEAEPTARHPPPALALWTERKPAAGSPSNDGKRCSAVVEARYPAEPRSELRLVCQVEAPGFQVVDDLRLATVCKNIEDDQVPVVAVLPSHDVCDAPAFRELPLHQAARQANGSEPFLRATDETLDRVHGQPQIVRHSARGRLRAHVRVDLSECGLGGEPEGLRGQVPQRSFEGLLPHEDRVMTILMQQSLTSARHAQSRADQRIEGYGDAASIRAVPVDHLGDHLLTDIPCHRDRTYWTFPPRFWIGRLRRSGSERCVHGDHRRARRGSRSGPHAGGR
jgi:hypothetical protein